MSGGSRLLTRIALFAALIYVLSWGTSYLPNVNLIFFVVFMAGFVWGAGAGFLVGLLGMGLWSAFNPYGPADFAIMLAQMFGMALNGPVGYFFGKTNWRKRSRWSLAAGLVLAAVVGTLLFYIPVNFADAWIYQPFWPRFITGMVWSLISLAANILIYPLLFSVARYLYDRESKLSWRSC